MKSYELTLTDADASYGAGAVHVIEFHCVLDESDVATLNRDRGLYDLGSNIRSRFEEALRSELLAIRTYDPRGGAA